MPFTSPTTTTTPSSPLDAGLESLVVVNSTQTATLAPSESESIPITPPSGYAYQPLDVMLLVLAPPGAVSGTHECGLILQDIARGVQGWATFNVHLQYRKWRWDLADIEQIPADAGAQAAVLQYLIATPTKSLWWIYSNLTDVDQTNLRNVYIVMKRIKLASTL